MNSFLFEVWICFLLVVLPIAESSCVGTISQSEFSALQALYISTNGSQWAWNEADSQATIWSFPNSLNAPCSNSWQGLVCKAEIGNASSCYIDEIALTRYHLVGNLPSELGQFLQLQSLSINENYLFGSIPSELGQLTRLQSLNLYTNGLIGTIPTTLGLLEQLQQLSLQENYLSGSLPSELGQLTQLQILYLFDNQLIGNLPSELGKLSEVQLIYVYTNQLRGSLPTELGELSHLLQFYVNNNSFSNTIPTELGQLSHLQVLGLYDNAFIGTIPTELGRLSALQALYLNSNSFNGTIPSEFGRLALLQQLSLFENKLIGTIPTEIGLLSQLLILYLDRNELEGTLPTEFGQLAQLEIAYMYLNRLEGTVPTELGQLLNLKQFGINENNFDGTIPNELSQLAKLYLLDMNHNSFTGSLPSEFRYLTSLQQLYLEGNLFSSIEIINTLNISILNISQNALIGPIPMFPNSIVYSDFSENILSGSIANALQNASMLSFLDLSDNRLTGTIPSYFLSFHRLQSLNISMNEFSGPLNNLLFEWPTRIGVLDASRNRLTGSVPNELFALPFLSSLLLYDNCFSGTLSSNICNSMQLQNVYLDSLTSSCGSRIPSNLRSVISASIPTKRMSGSIPLCVWDMSTLQLLHLQGNGLTGTLGELSVNSSLSVVMLSSNALSGSLPLTWQSYGKFSQLDLSRNKLSGVLSNGYITNAKATLLDLTVNRLSGRIPQSFQNTSYVVNLLDGNLFQCQTGSIPQQDPSYEGYVCGSSGFNVALEFGIVLLVSSIAAMIWVIHERDWLELGQSVAVGMLETQERVTVWNAQWMISMCCMSLLCYLLLKLIATLSKAFSTHAVQYAWSSTAVYLRGWLPVCGIMLMLLGSACLWLWMQRSWMTDVIKETSQQQQQQEQQKVILSSSPNKQRLMIGIMHLANLIIVLAVNGTYVDVVLSGLSTWKLFWVQIALSLFKLLWGNVIVPLLLSLTSVRGRSSMFHTVVMTFVSLIVGPFVSTFFTSSDCFKNLFVGIAQVQSTSVIRSYSCSNQCVSTCTSYLCYTNCVDICGLYEPLQLSLVITPPWIYSFQCSSSLLINYIPVMIYAVVLSDIFRPFLEMLYFLIPIRNIRVVLQYIPHRIVQHYVNGTIYAIGREQALPLTDQGKRILQVEHLWEKRLVSTVLFMTFGIASPLLSIVLISGMLLQCVRNKIVLGRLLHLLSNDKEHRAQLLERMNESGSISFGEVYAVFIVTGMFWGLFFFDMIGDVYGSLAGGLAVLLPFSLVCIVICIHMTMKVSLLRERKTSLIKDIELVESSASASAMVLT